MGKNIQNLELSKARKQFGQLIKALRLEQVDESKNYTPWTQYKLHEVTGLSENVIRNIELGRKAQVEEDILLRIADAFKLTSSERREFFLVSANVDRSDIVRQQSEPEQALARILDYLEGTRLPFFISDSYCDVIYANDSLITLLNMGDALRKASLTHAGYNVARAVFDENYNYRELMGENWEMHAVYNMRYFRERTLASRHTQYFRYLFSHLSQLQQFYRYWFEMRFDQNDYFSGHIGYNYMHPRFGHMQYTACETVTVTAAGNLSTVVYAPTNRNTTQSFEILAQEVGTGVLNLASWPEKIIPNTSGQKTQSK